MMLKIKDIYAASHDVLITTIEGEAINLLGKDVKKVIPANGKFPEREVTIRGATESDLHKLRNSHKEFIEDVEKPQSKQAAVTPAIGGKQ